MKRWQVLVASVVAAGAVACGSGSSLEERLVPVYQSPPGVSPTPDPPKFVAPQGIRCKDGTISHARHRQGACSHHGGIS